MSEYQNLNPIFASSTMKILKNKTKLKFFNIINYDYLDLMDNKKWENYFTFLENSTNFNAEILLYWENLQNFLDEEVNKINDKEISLNVLHCTIQFHDKSHPYVQWIVEFEGNYNFGKNIYENFVEKEILQYPIYSLYIFDPPLKALEVISSLQYNISNSGRIIEYYGQPKDKLDGYEAIYFSE